MSFLLLVPKMDILRPPLIRIGKRCYRKVLGPDKEDHNPEDEEIDLGTMCFYFYKWKYFVLWAFRELIMFSSGIWT